LLVLGVESSERIECLRVVVGALFAAELRQAARTDRRMCSECFELLVPLSSAITS